MATKKEMQAEIDRLRAANEKLAKMLQHHLDVTERRVLTALATLENPEEGARRAFEEAMAKRQN